MRLDDQVALNLAHALLTVAWTPQELDRAVVSVLPSMRPRTRAKLIKGLVERFAGELRPAPTELSQVLLGTTPISGAVRSIKKGRRKWRMSLAAPRFEPMLPFKELDIPEFVTPFELTSWLDIEQRDLDWMADTRHQSARANISILQHYRYAFAHKRSGAPRLIEEPKPRLKAIQRRILREILSNVPTHDAAHGYVCGRSCLTSASVHVGEKIVVALDLKDFFLRTPMGRISGLFRALGYPFAVARLLSGLCTTATPRSVFRRLPVEQRHDFTTQQRFAMPHLPQGAPTSPTLANLVAYRLDLRLTGLARVYDVNYTRYADDLTFSGGHGLSQRLPRFIMLAERIIHEEGYLPNPAKTRVMPIKGRQRVTGIVVNSHVNVARRDYDVLKATLNNCVQHGPLSQNRDQRADFRAHLDGRVSWVEQVNRKRGAKLRGLYEAIAWS